MTDDMMNLRSLVEKSADADLLREMIGFAAEKLMALEVGTKTGAGYGEKNGFRLAQCNGYRDRDWETRAGTVEIVLPIASAAAFRIDKAMPAGGRKLPTLVECVAYGVDLAHAGERRWVVRKERDKNMLMKKLSPSVLLSDSTRN